MTVALRPLQPGDEEAAVRWAADPLFCQAADWTVGLSPRVIRRHWSALITGKQADFRRWGVTLDGQLMGYVDLANLSAFSGELGVAIGERSLWGQGVARQACELLLQEAWARGLHTVTAEVHEANMRSHALMRRLGFEKCGTRAPEPSGRVLMAVVQYLLKRQASARHNGISGLTPEQLTDRLKHHLP